MTITHTITLTTGTTVLRTEYDQHTNSLTRIVQPHIYTVYLKHRTDIATLYRISQLDDEVFSGLANISRRNR